MPEHGPRIAVQLFGHLRTWQSCAAALREHVLDRYDCDVFVHTWDRTDHQTGTWHDSSSAPAPVEAALIESTYAPVSLKIETQDFLEEEGTFGRHRISLLGIRYMLYSKYQATLLREEHQRARGAAYDYVLVTRPDILLHAALKFEDYADQFRFFDGCSIHLVHGPNSYVLDDRIFSVPIASDCLYFAKPEVVDMITRAYLDFERFFRQGGALWPEGLLHPEEVFFERIRQKGIVPKCYRFYYSIRRTDPSQDVGLLPASERPEPEPVAPEAGRGFKAMLRWLVDRSPRPVLRLFRRVQARMSDVGAYIDRLEDGREARRSN